MTPKSRATWAIGSELSTTFLAACSLNSGVYLFLFLALDPVPFQIRILLDPCPENLGHLKAYWRTELRRGRTRAAIEESLTGNGTKLNLRAVAALALFGDIAEAGNVPDRLGRQWGHAFAGTYRALNRGAHQGHPGELDGLIADTRALVGKIAEKLP